MGLTCLVEIPRGSRNKYEYDEERQLLGVRVHDPEWAAVADIENASARFDARAGAHA